jgi:hypothetical protein
MKCITVCTHARKLAIAAIFGSLFCLAGCDSGPGKDATAPPTNVEGLARTADTVAPTTATGDDYNALMRKQQEERQKKGSQYPKKR